MDRKTLLEARAKDLLNTFRRRGFAQSDFLTEEEQALVLRIYEKERFFSFAFDGGVKGCERKTVLLSDDPEHVAGQSGVRFVFVRARSGAPLEHRALLGSLLGTGLERQAVGDLFAYEDGFAAALPERLVPFVCENLSRVGKEAVDVSLLSLPDDFRIDRRSEELRLNVPSLRLDCIVSELCRLSRQDAADYIRNGMAQIDHTVCDRPDKKLSGGELLSLRGKGRFLLTGETKTTRSGRLAVTVLHYL